MWRRRNAGTQRSVTAAITPSAPSETRAASSSSPPSSRALGCRRRAPARRSDLPREVRQLRAGPVRARRERAGQRLGVDVAQVRHREATGVQLTAERVEADARPRRARARGGVGVEHAVRVVEREQRAVGDRRPRPSRCPHRRPGPGRAVDDHPAPVPRASVAAEPLRRARREPDQLTHSTAADGTVRAMDVTPSAWRSSSVRGDPAIDVRAGSEWDAARIAGARHLRWVS